MLLPQHLDSGISEIKHFIENFRSDDQHDTKALDVLIEDQRIQILQRVQI